MASKQSGAVNELYRRWKTVPGADPEWTMQDQQNLMNEWDVLTGEPGGVDYLEADVSGVPALWAVPLAAALDRVLLCIHGGGFISGSMFTHRKMFAHLAKGVGARALIMNYRLLPDGTFPEPVQDVLVTYRWLLDQGIQPGHIAFVGDSAGGNLAMAAQLQARAEGLPLPAATMLLSPWVDMAATGESMMLNKDKDALFSLEWVVHMAQDFLAGTDPRDPLVNSLHADLTGLGPIFAQVGDQELLLDDARALTDHAEKCGVETRLDVFADMQHSFQMMAGRAPEADDAMARFAAWAKPKLGL